MAVFHEIVLYLIPIIIRSNNTYAGSESPPRWAAPRPPVRRVSTEPPSPESRRESASLPNYRGYVAGGIAAAADCPSRGCTSCPNSFFLSLPKSPPPMLYRSRLPHNHRAPSLLVQVLPGLGTPTYGRVERRARSGRGCAVEGSRQGVVVKLDRRAARKRESGELAVRYMRSDELATGVTSRPSDGQGRGSQPSRLHC
jgi:hypothetical protein